jgi:hypothetical protein
MVYITPTKWYYKEGTTTKSSGKAKQTRGTWFARLTVLIGCIGRIELL